MACEKGSGSMTSVRGMCSSSSNPLPKARKVEPMCGPGSNPDMKLANKLLQQAQRNVDALRGVKGF